MSTGTIAVRHSQTVCPQEVRIANRQAKNRERESTVERRREVAAWCVGKTCSCGCGRPATTPHHPSTDLYHDNEIWADLRECEPWNGYCHGMYHKGWRRCPECGGWMRPTAANHETCYRCRGGDTGHRIRRGILPHRCAHNVGHQRCQRGDGCLRICSRSSRKAHDCEYFMARVVALS